MSTSKKSCVAPCISIIKGTGLIVKPWSGRKKSLAVVEAG